jgi:hypothetical protein
MPHSVTDPDKGWGEPARARYERVAQCTNLFRNLRIGPQGAYWAGCQTLVPLGVPFCSECREPDYNEFRYTRATLPS